MSYIYNNQIQYSDTSNLDAFGRLRVSNVTSLLELKNTNNLDSVVTGNIVQGGADYSWDASCTSMNVYSAGDKCIRFTKNSAVYQPGKSQLFEASFCNFQQEAGVIKRVGLFTTLDDITDDELDGIFLESNENTISFQIWNNGIQTFASSIDTWYTSEFNPFDIDWRLDQLLMIDYQWLGVGRVRFSLIIDGRPIKFSEYSFTNNVKSTYMTRPNKPIRYEISSYSGSGNFVQICSQISTEGRLNNLYETTGVVSNEVTLPGLDIYPLLGYRLGKKSIGASCFLDDCSILQTTNDNYIFFLLYNPVLNTAVNWSSVNYTPIEIAEYVPGLLVNDTNFIVSANYCYQNSLSSLPFKGDDNLIKPGISPNGTFDEIWLCVQPLSSNSKFSCAANIKYFR